MDWDGNVTYAPIDCNENEDCTGGGGSSGPGVSVMFDWYFLHDAHEPWYKGDPEIYTITTLRERNVGDLVEDHRENQYFMREGAHHTDGNKILVTYYGNYGGTLDAFIEVYEDDISDPDDPIEYYGGWFRNCDVDKWYLWNESLTSYKEKWSGDDGGCDFRIFLSYF